MCKKTEQKVTLKDVLYVFGYLTLVFILFALATVSCGLLMGL